MQWVFACGLNLYTMDQQNRLFRGQQSVFSFYHIHIAQEKAGQSQHKLKSTDRFTFTYVKPYIVIRHGTREKLKRHDFFYCGQAMT